MYLVTFNGRFGGYDGQMKQTSGFTFTLRMDTKEKPDKTYNPKNSMVSLKFIITPFSYT